MTKASTDASSPAPERATTVTPSTQAASTRGSCPTRRSMTAEVRFTGASSALRDDARDDEPRAARGVEGREHAGAVAGDVEGHDPAVGRQARYLEDGAIRRDRLERTGRGGGNRPGEPARVEGWGQKACPGVENDRIRAAADQADRAVGTSHGDRPRRSRASEAPQVTPSSSASLPIASSWLTPNSVTMPTQPCQPADRLIADEVLALGHRHAVGDREREPGGDDRDLAHGADRAERLGELLQHPALRRRGRRVCTSELGCTVATPELI